MKLQCYDCGTEMVSVILDQYPQNSSEAGIVIFQDVPCWECPKCGRRYFTHQVASEMDDVLAGRVAPAGKREVATHSLRGAAA